MSELEWHHDEALPGDVNFKQNDFRVRTDGNQDPRSEKKDVDPAVLNAADGFYSMFKSACHGIDRRLELEQLYNATYASFGCLDGERPEFSKVLFAMAHSLKVLRVIRGGTISWKFANRDQDRRGDRDRDHRPRLDDRRRDDGRHDRRDDYRPRFDDRRRDDSRDDYRPRFDDRRRDDRDRDHRPRFDDRRRDDRRDDYRPRFDEWRRDPRDDVF
jgi:hypothetical protein